jgi:hypothetical protein
LKFIHLLYSLLVLTYLLVLSVTLPPYLPDLRTQPPDRLLQLAHPSLLPAPLGCLPLILLYLFLQHLFLLPHHTYYMCALILTLRLQFGPILPQLLDIVEAELMFRQ